MVYSFAVKLWLKFFLEKRIYKVNPGANQRNSLFFVGNLEKGMSVLVLQRSRGGEKISLFVERRETG
jgi:hypothetical protein